MATLIKTYLKWPIIITLLGLGLAVILGFHVSDDPATRASFVLTAIILAALEISLSFDNAVVNANRLEDMDEVWRRRFLTWGILIAVFGMRIIFPLAVVSIAAWIDPIEALELALLRPDDYARIISEAHLSISAFGGTFLTMVALSFFLDEDKDIHWIPGLESGLKHCASIRGVEIAFMLAVILSLQCLLPGEDGGRFLFGALTGLLAFTLIESLAQILDKQSAKASKSVAKGGLGAFLYLELIDASFSFDGVIGAFALTTNLLLIAIGLGIGAMYVRALTIMIVEKQTLEQFRYLEHGAFYSVLALATALLFHPFVHIPELVTGGFGIGLIALALWSSIRRRKALG